MSDYRKLLNITVNTTKPAIGDDWFETHTAPNSQEALDLLKPDLHPLFHQSHPIIQQKRSFASSTTIIKALIGFANDARRGVKTLNGRGEGQIDLDWPSHCFARTYTN